MNYRRIGQTELDIAPLAFGGNVLGWTLREDRDAFRLLDAIVDQGFNMIDTADRYSAWVEGHAGGESEAQLGRWFAQTRGRRHQVILASKCGKSMGPGRQGLSPAYIEEAVHASLRRLRTDYIDVQYAHCDDPDTPLADTLGAFERLVRQGKLRVVGASNFAPDRLQAALAAADAQSPGRYQALQPLYNLYDRAPFEAELASICQQQQLAVLPYFALAAGFLSGKYRSEADLVGRARAAMVAPRLTPRGLRILDALEVAARRLSAPPAAVALAWLIQQPGVTAAIVSATSFAQWQELARATSLSLDPLTLSELAVASAEEPPTS